MQNIKGITMKQKAMEQEMMEQEQKENLLRLLDDQDVKDKIIASFVYLMQDCIEAMEKRLHHVLMVLKHRVRLLWMRRYKTQ